MGYSLSFAQSEVRIKAVNTEGAFTRIYYSLQGNEPGLPYKITPYYVDSLGDRHLIRWVSGDVGPGVEAGEDKVIVWESRRELEHYQGAMRIALEHAVMPQSVELQLPRKSYRRAGKVTVPWDRSLGPRYELLGSDQEVLSTGTWNETSRGYQLKLPRTLPLSQQYQIRIPNEKGLPAYSFPFTVQRRIPLAVQIGGVGLVVGTVLYLLLQDSSEELPAPIPIRSINF